MVENIPKSIYENFSFKEGEKPNFDKMLEHFIPEGLFINNKGETPMVTQRKKSRVSWPV